MAHGFGEGVARASINNPGVYELGRTGVAPSGGQSEREAAAGSCERAVTQVTIHGADVDRAARDGLEMLLPDAV